MKAQRDESGGRILLGDNTSGGAAMLQLIRFLCAGVWISTGLLSMCVCVCVFVFVCVCVCVCGEGAISTNHKVPPRYEFITAVFIKMHVFRHITPSRLVNINVLGNHSASTFKVQPSNLAYNSKFRRHYVRNGLLADTLFVLQNLYLREDRLYVVFSNPLQIALS